MALAAITLEISTLAPPRPIGLMVNARALVMLAECHASVPVVLELMALIKRLLTHFLSRRIKKMAASEMFLGTRY